MLSDVRMTLVSQTERHCRRDSGGNIRFIFVCCLHRRGDEHKHSRVQNLLRKQYIICVRFLHYHTLCHSRARQRLSSCPGGKQGAAQQIDSGQFNQGGHSGLIKWWKMGTWSHPRNSSHLLRVVILSLDSCVVPLWDSCSLPPPSALCQSQGFHWFVCHPIP